MSKPEVICQYEEGRHCRHPECVGYAEEAARQPPDVRVTGAGSTLLLFHPLSPEAKTWMKEHIEEEAHYLGDALAVEPRYAENIVCAMRRAGLEVR